MREEHPLTILLKRSSDGDQSASNELAPLVYDELHRRARALLRRESAAESIQATLLVDDAYMRLVHGAEVDWASRTHFYALASRVMRQVLVEHARARTRLKRGGAYTRVQFEEGSSLSLQRDADVLELDEALQRLAERDPQQADIVTMRFFGGMDVQEIADALGISKRQVERKWTLIKAWLRRELSG